MTKKKPTTAPAEDAAPVTPQAAWPFPKSVHTPRKAAKAAPTDEESEPKQEQPTERVQPTAINLYTDPALNTIERIDLQLLFDSPFQPRTRYDQKALNELADTIRGVGIMQPILARPLNDMPVTDGSGAPVKTYEIVYGHRRVRAGKLAGETTAPVIVRNLTDAQSAQLQAIENVQREPLDAIDEAEGFAHYIAAHGVSKEQLAAEIGRSRTHVYSRLKLLNAVPALREAIQAREIGSEVAVLVSRIHTHKLQEKALASLKSNGRDLTDGGASSFRRIQEFLKERFTLNLSDALFDRNDADLVAFAGTCTDCPKRTGNAPEFEDLKEGREDRWGHKVKGEPNLCTDPDCFDAKKKAHLANKAAALEAKGKTVVAGGKARAAIGADGAVKGGYIALKDIKAELAKAKAKKGGDGPEVASVVIQDPRTGKTVEAVKLEDVKAAGVKVKEPRTNSGVGHEQQRMNYAAERERREAQAALNTKVHCAVLAQVRKAAAAVPRSAFDLQMVALVTFAGVSWNSKSVVATLHGFKDAEQLVKQIGQMTVEQLTALMLDCALADHVVDDGYGNAKPGALLNAAKHYGVDVAAIRKEVTAMAPDTRTQDLLKPEQLSLESAAA
jgi:ParB/RepB/Spo0J family partition protein